ncbi:grpE nucleotide exchange factor, coiled-coil [Artemisia annua]|uniref:GrpE nucleotide exchange factor, coiled-coil n=1 Tax=Artemisia annua TaxID=35608 RepID=A0A2U1LXJ3_ARTAN|nr:grpE nucleotide exchange factor, coiled-coil [Artemisia annua]
MVAGGGRGEMEAKVTTMEACGDGGRMRAIAGKGDNDISEAAVTSCTQQKKIQELEAQLQEAEDIVKDLREELRAVEAQLAKFTKIKEVKHPVQVDYVSTPEPITIPPSAVKPISNNQTNKSQSLYKSLFPLKKSLLSNADLPSIISRSKETELYRNGCTQRIRACERIPLDKTLPFPVKPNDSKNTDKKDEVLEKDIVLEQVKEMDIAADNSCERTSLDKKLSFSVKTNDNNNPKSISKENEVLENEIVLEQVKEMDIAADNSCLTSPSSVKHTNDTTIEDNSNESIVKDLEITCNSQSTSQEELMSMSQEKDKVDPPLKISETEVSKTEVQSQPLTDRVIKLTFQRKRKRGATIDGSGSSEMSQENQSAPVSPMKVNLIGESTPEKKRLEQVAHQLISLSDKNCW